MFNFKKGYNLGGDFHLNYSEAHIDFILFSGDHVHLFWNIQFEGGGGVCQI